MTLLTFRHITLVKKHQIHNSTAIYYSDFQIRKRENANCFFLKKKKKKKERNRNSGCVFVVWIRNVSEMELLLAVMRAFIY